MTSDPSTRERAPHASLNIPGRRPKAEKIRTLLPLDSDARGPLRLLEIGTGSGAIASHFGGLAHPRFDVDAVDVIDQRRVFAGYRFRLVAGVELPYEDGSFDVVLSNHVLEHVGEWADQAKHLREISRVLSPRGVAYLASPNRWQLVEPHFHVPFLSCLPKGMRSGYLSLWRLEKTAYDCEPLEMAAIELLMDEAQLESRNICVEALRSLVALEARPSLGAKVANLLPEHLVWRLRSICPTHVYLLRHKTRS
jgi:SAM-dependent methyltransferase